MKYVAAVALLGCAAFTAAQERKPDPARRDLALWSGIKRSLSAPDGEEYFQQNLKDFALPPIAGTLISSTPADRPNVLVLAISDTSTPELTLRLKDDSGKDAHLNAPILRGSEVRFEGAVVAFTKTPFMLTVETSPTLGHPRRR